MHEREKEARAGGHRRYANELLSENASRLRGLPVYRRIAGSRGPLFGGYEHWRAATAEGVIAAVLVFGLFARLIRPASARVTALAVQVFALLGTLIGASTIAIGIGPQTTVDHAFHLFLLAVPASGLVAIFRSIR